MGSTQVLELGKINDELQKEKSKALLNTQHALIARESNSRKGQKRWPLFTWEIILEQLVNGTCPSAIKANIVSIVSHFSPSTKIIELPSIWTMRRGRTVLLAVVQTLAIDEKLIDKRLQVCFLFDEPDGRQLLSWCKGVVVAVKKKYIYIVLEKWEQELLRDGESETTQQKL